MFLRYNCSVVLSERLKGERSRDDSVIEWSLSGMSCLCRSTLYTDGCIHFSLLKGLFRAATPNSSLFSLAVPLLEDESAA